jgi:hypothetical protein
MKVSTRVTAFHKITEHWDADDPGRFFVLGQAEVERAGEPGGEAFSVTVISPSHLSAMAAAEAADPILGRGKMIVSDYDEAAIVRALQRVVDSATEDSWNGVRAAVERFFDWLD